MKSTATIRRYWKKNCKLLLFFMSIFFVSIIFHGKPHSLVSAADQDGMIELFDKDSMEDTRKTDKPNPFDPGESDSIKNLAFEKPIEASSSYGDWTAEKAVDGVDNRENRWQSGENVDVFEPVYLDLDIGAKSELSSIRIKFDTKMYGNFKIETSATKDDGSWENVVSVNDVPEGDDLHIEYNKNFVEDGKEPLNLERYVRVYFTDGNPSAGNQSIGIQDLELYGSQEKEKITGNIALNKRIKASNEYGDYFAYFANNGISDVDQERWQSGEDVQKFKPVSLEFDLREKSKITGVNIKFARLMYGNFEIQTSAKNGEDAEWETLHKVTDIETSDEVDPPFKEWIFDEKETERYVRLYFTDVNPNAGNKSIGIFEIELIGEQVVSSIQPPSSANQVIRDIDELRVDENGTQIIFPKIDENYEVTLKGSDEKNVISDDGMITNYNFDKHDTEVLVQVVNKKNESDRAEKNLTVQIPSKKNLYPKLFPEIENPNEEPEVIPSLQEWSGYEGNFELSEKTRIVVNDDKGLDLIKIAEEFKADVKEFTGLDLEVTTGKTNSNDIELVSLDKDKYDLGEEGYILLNNDNGLKIYSQTYMGVLYGTVTIEQVLYAQKETEKYQFPKGIIRDYPQFEVRGVMMDIGRIPYRMDMLEALSKAFSFYKINEMHLHLNDDLHEHAVFDAPNDNWEKAQKRFSGFRLESDTFPSLGPDDRSNDFFNNVQYSKEEYIDLQKNAKTKGVEIVSEIDAPGHALGFNKYVENNRDEAAAAGIDGDIRNKENAELLALSGENYENSAKFIRLLFDEYLGIKDDEYNENDAIFIGDTVHIGADEYWEIDGNPNNPENAEQRINYGKYVEDMHDKVTQTGRSTRVWGHFGAYLDGQADINTEELNDIVIDVWAPNLENVQKRIDENYSLVNVDNSWLYGNPGRDRRDIVNVEYLYENWTPHIMQGYEFKKGEPALIGAKTALWADINLMGVTERDSFERLIRSASVVAEKTWGGTSDDSTFDDFSFAFSKLYGGPGINIASDIPATGDMVLDYNFNNVEGDSVYDFTGNDYHGEITNGKIKEEEDTTWMQFDGNTEITTSIDSLDYPYTVQFDIKLNDEEMSENKKAILFDGYDGRLSIDEEGKLSINYSFHTQDFDYTVPVDEKTNITLVGTQQVTKLYVNGKLSETLVRDGAGEKNFDSLLSTFVFPLQKIGKGFNGKLSNINVYKKAMNPRQVLNSHNKEEQTKVNVSQNKGVTGHAQNKGEGWWDQANKKLQVAWKAIDGDGDTLEGTHKPTESDKDSFFHGRLDDSHIGLDFFKEYDVSEIVLQFDQKPSDDYTLQRSEDGKNWEDIGSYNESKVTFEEPISTQYLRLVGSQFKLREIEVYEAVDKSELKELLAEAKPIVDSLQSKDHDTLFNAYKSAKSLYGNEMAYQTQIETISNNLLEALEDLEPSDEPDEKAAEEVSNLLATLPTKGNVTLEDKDAIEAGRTAYDALTEAEQDLVVGYAKDRLTNAEAELEILGDEDSVAVKKVKSSIYNLPKASELTLADKDKIKEVRDMYNNLSDDDKEFVTSISQLEVREDRITELEDKRDATQVKRRIYNLPKASELTLKDKEAVEEVRVMYDDLSQEAKALVTTISQLEAREDKLAELAN